VDRHRFDADPAMDPNLHVDADPVPDPHGHKNNACPHAGPTSSFTQIGKSEFLFFLSRSIATIQCFIFLISVTHVLFSVL
jgi:hypothetical protein